MMNVLEVQDNLKNFSEQQLVKEMQQPSGSTPQFLVLSELNRRKRVKGDFEARQSQNQPTVAQDVVASAGVPQQGMMGMSEAMAPQSVESGGIGSMMPKTMKNGGEVEGYAEGGVVRAANGLSLADRNMNPGNIRPAGFMGETGINSGYSTYASPEFGLRAMSRLSDTYASKGIGTIRDYINRYAPPTDNNKNNEAYANMVADALGVGVDDPVDFTDDNVKRAIMPAMAQFEGYKGDLGEDLINKGIAASKTDDVTKANDLLAGVDSFDPSNLFGINKRKVVYQGGEENKNSTSNVPKGVRPDFTIDSIPKNIREQKYLQELIKQRDVGKQQKRPILSDIINKEIEKEKDNQKPSILEEKLKPLGFPPFPDPYAQNRDAQIAGLEGRSNQDVYSDGYGIFTDVDPLENIKSKTIKENVTKDLIEQNKMPNVKKVGGSDDAVTKKILQNLGPSQESLNQINNEDAFIGSDIPIVDELRSQVTDNSNKVTEKPKSKKTDTTSLTSLEQELLNRQNQMKKDRDFDKYMALAQAGLSIMSSDKPTLAGAIGEGGTAGLEAFRGAQKRYQEGLNDILNARVKLAGKKGGLSQKEAISSIASIDSAIAKYRTDADKAVDPAAITKIQDAIAQLNFQKRSLMPIAGYSYLNTDVSDTTAAKG